MRAGLLAACVCGGLGACYPSSNVCSVTLQPIPGSDGGYPCGTAADCPRGAEVFVCLDNGVPPFACVSCDQGACVLHAPNKCQ